MLDLKAAAERESGTAIAPEEYARALPYARRKLNFINERYGTNHGNDYLAILVSETVRANRFTAYLNFINRAGSVIKGQKEGAAHPQVNSPNL